MNKVEIIGKSKPDSKIKIWFRKTKDNFVDWWFKPWTVKDFLAIFGALVFIGNVVSIIVGSVRAAHKKK